MQKPKFSIEDLILRVHELEKENAQLKESYYSEKRKNESISDNKKLLLTQALLNASKMIPTCNTFHEAAKYIFNELKELLKVDAGYVALLNKETGMNEIVHLEPGSQICMVSPDLPMPVRGYRATVYKSKEVKYHNDFGNSKWMKLMPKGHTVLHNIMFIPMLVNDEAVGLIGLSNKPGGFTDEDAEMAKEFGILAVVALEYSNRIEERIQTEKKLKESNEKYKDLYEKTPVMLHSIDNEGRLLSVSDFWLQKLGYTKQEVIGRKSLEFLTPQSQEKFYKYFPDFKEKGKINNMAYQMVRKNGELIDVLLSAISEKNMDGTLKRTLAVIIDVTEQKKAEIELAKLNRKSNVWLENSPVCTKILDIDFNLQYMSQAGINELQIEDINEFYGKPYPFHFYPDSFKIPMNENLKKAKETGKTITQEAFVNDIRGNKLWYHSTIVPVYDTDNKLDYMMVVSSEITKRKNAEQELIKAQEKELEHSLKFKRLFDQVKDPIYIYNPDNFEILEANRATSEVYGYTEDELIGMSCLKFSAEVQKSIAIGEKLIKEGQAEVKFRHHKKKDGTDVFIEINGYKIRVNNKDVMFIVCKDITDKVKAEQNLIKAKTKAEENEAKYNLVAEYTYDWETYYDSKANILFVNSAFEKITGYSKDAFRLKKIQFKDFVHKEDLPEFERIFEAIFKGKTIDNYSFRIIHKNGKIVFIEICSQGVFDSNNGLIGIRTSHRDITDRKIAEQELINSEEKFRLIVNALPQFISYCSVDFKYLYVNKSYEKEFGIKQKDIENQRIVDIIGENAFEQAKVHMQKVIEGEYVRYYEKLKYKNGSVKHIDGQLIPHFNTDEKVVGYYGVLSDISPYIEAHELLEKSEKEKSIILESMSEMLTYCDKDLNIIWANKAAKKFRKKNEKDFEGKKCYQAWNNEDAPCENCSAIKALDSGVMEESELKTPDGRFFKLRVYPVKNAKGQIEGVVEFVADITEQKKKDDEQKRIYNLYRTLASNLPGINVFLFDTDKRILITEGSDFKKGVFKKSDFEGKLLSELDYEEDVRHYFDNINNSVLEGKEAVEELNYYNLWYRHIAVPIKNHKNTVIGGLMVAQNITEQKKATIELENSKEKLKQLSAYTQQIIEKEKAHVAREIHDELGQNLTYIKLNLALLYKNLNKELDQLKSPQFKNIYDIVDQAIKKVKKISSDLRPGLIDDLGLVPAIEWHVSEFIKQTGLNCEFITNNEHFVVNKELSINIFRIIQEALTNCVKYAKASKIKINLTENNGSLNLTIHDNGIGIKQSDTKKNNSLGILGMKERVELFNGSFSIQGSTKNGTTIKIKIPKNK